MFIHMNRIPPKLREELSNDPYMKLCIRSSDECSGRITYEHALLYANKQIQEKFCIIPLCWHHHLGEGLNKAWNIDFAMKRAVQEDRSKYPKLPWHRYPLTNE